MLEFSNSENKFIYSFDISKEIAHFKDMPEDIQSSAECNAVDVIYESFVVTADQDYLMSRLLAKKGLARGFYWAAAQAVEKYLKAILLMNGESVKEFKGHLIKPLFDAVIKIDSSLTELNIHPHHSIQLESDISNYLKTFTIQDFIGDLENHGSANNRYNAFGVEYNTGHLLAMDSLSFQLRRKIGVIEINGSFKRFEPELISIFMQMNPWFQVKEGELANKIPSHEFPIIESHSVTKLEFLIKNNSNPAYMLALKWLESKMKLPKRVK